MKRSYRIIFFTVAWIFCSTFVYAVEEAINPAQSVSEQKEKWDPQIVRRITSQPLKVFVLDVGQGDSIFIEFPYGETMLVDAGSWDSYGIPHIKAFLKDYFKANKYKNNTIDVVVASHPDADHIKGLKDILTSYIVNWYIDNDLPSKTRMYRTLMNTVKEYDENDRMDYIAIKEDSPKFKEYGFYRFNDIVHFKDADIYVLGSYKGDGKQEVNNASVVLKIAYGNTSILLTGDSEGENELDRDKYVEVNTDKYEENRIYKRLKENNRLDMLRSNILKIGHHGSASSSSEIYLSEVAPEISVVSVGDYKISSHAVRFGHPRLETIERLDKYTTGENEEQSVKAFKDKTTKKDFITKKAIYLTAKEHTLDGKSVESFGDIVIFLDGDKVSKMNK